MRYEAKVIKRKKKESKRRDKAEGIFFLVNDILHGFK